MIEVSVGKKIPLSLQVYDGNSQLEVNCVLIKNDGTIYFSDILTHSVDGLYLNNSIEMPDVDFLIAQYRTNKPLEYEIAQDIFQGIPKVQIPEKYILGEVIDTVELSEQDDFLIGEVQNVDEEV